MQTPGKSFVRWLLHLGLLAGLLALFLALSESEDPSADGSFRATTVSAFKTPLPKELPALGQEDVRRQVKEVFAGLPQHGATLGNRRAPVTMKLFADPECPQARQFAIRVLPKLVRRWVRSGKVRIDYVGVPAETIWPEVFRRQQMAVLAAGHQGKLWQYLGFFYHYQGPEFTKYANDWFLSKLATEVRGLDTEAWARDRYSPLLTPRFKRDMEITKARGVTNTPAFSIGPSGGSLEPLLHFTLTEPLAFEAAFEKALGA